MKKCTKRMRYYMVWANAFGFARALGLAALCRCDVFRTAGQSAAGGCVCARIASCMCVWVCVRFLCLRLGRNTKARLVARPRFDAYGRTTTFCSYARVLRPRVASACVLARALGARTPFVNVDERLFISWGIKCGTSRGVRG